MKLIGKICLALIVLYGLLWGGLAAYFSYAEGHKDLLEKHLTQFVGRDVTIETVDTVWQGVSPSMRITGLQIAGDQPNQPALAIESISWVANSSSLFKFWPTFSEFAVEKPQVEIVSLPDNRLQIAGIELGANEHFDFNRKRLMSWLLSQESAAWHNGEVRWRRLDGSSQTYRDISFVYEREEQAREINLALSTPSGKLAFRANSQGDLLSPDDWDAHFEVRGASGKNLLNPRDFTVDVNNGRGQIHLKHLDVQRVQDFLVLSGLIDSAPWIGDSNLSGRLHDVTFDFSGALIDLNEWQLKASASEVGFESVGAAPAMNNLNGVLQASSNGGSFQFSTATSVFEWQRWFDKSFPIKDASGVLNWTVNKKGQIKLTLDNGRFADSNLQISNLNASLGLIRTRQKVSSFGQLFELDSLEDLSFESGEVVANSRRLNAPELSVNADFEVYELKGIAKYLPTQNKIAKFRKWVDKAYKRGQLTNGKFKFVGPLSVDVFKSPDLELLASADFNNVTVDYAPEHEWPPATQSSGQVVLDNDLLTVSPDQVWLNGDPVTDGVLTIEKLFVPERTLKVSGKTTTSLPKGMQFLFQGPLLPKDKRPKSLPVTPVAGYVDIDVAVELPLDNMNAVAVSGTSVIRDGHVSLPGEVPMTNIGATVSFTEDSVSSNSIRAKFLGGETRGKLITTEKASPPKMRVTATGNLNTAELEPWTGEHLLTLFFGHCSLAGYVGYRPR